MARCLVLGGNGFIGSHLVDSLVNSGHTVRVFDRPGVGPRYAAKDVELYAGNFLNTSDLEEALKNIEYVFHFISTTTPATAENDPRIDIDTNIRMSIELFDLCAKLGVKKVIFASTGGAIYGEAHDDQPHRETDLPQPVSPYAIGKLTIEHYLRYFRVKRGLDSIVVRISNPYGDRQVPGAKQGVIPIFIENLISGHPITVLGDGSMVRDYVYVRDVTDIVVKMFDKPTQHAVYNIGSGKPVSVNDIIHVIEKVSGERFQIEHREVPLTFVHRVTLDITRIQKEFDLSPQMSLEEGIRTTYKYLLKEMKA